MDVTCFSFILGLGGAGAWWGSPSHTERYQRKAMACTGATRQHHSVSHSHVMCQIHAQNRRQPPWKLCPHTWGCMGQQVISTVPALSAVFSPCGSPGDSTGALRENTSHSRITGSVCLEKTSEISKSNPWPNTTTLSAKPWHWVPHPDFF